VSRAVREYHYRVDREGRVFHDGTEVVDAATLRFFLLAMKRTEDGRHLVLCQGEQNWFEAEGTPFVVVRLHLTLDGDRLRAVQLVFAGEYREPLDPDGLEAEADRLYCRVRGGAFRARFGRAAMQQISPFLGEADGGLALVLEGARHPIRAVTSARTMSLAPPGAS
jgi:hypothetical protein